VTRTLDIVIPMAGRGSRFEQQGFKLPKPLIDVDGKPMIERVIENLRPTIPHRFIFLVLQEHLEQFGLAEKLRGWAGAQSVLVRVAEVTEGAACTVLLAKAHLSQSNDMVIANSDQVVDFAATEYFHWSRASQAAGTILVFEDDNEKWSFAKLDDGGQVVQVAEKKRISNLATVGIYYFQQGTDFVVAAEQMMRKDIRVNGEFYVCPVFNEMIANRQRILTWKIDKAAMHGVGTPEDLAAYLRQVR
jgi:NDP-sugar pyrophosphorylase family protein